jgi:hypothetical protein
VEEADEQDLSRLSERLRSHWQLWLLGSRQDGASAGGSSLCRSYVWIHSFVVNFVRKCAILCKLFLMFPFVSHF